MKRKISYIIILLLAAVLAGFLFTNHKQEQRKAAHMQQLQRDAKPYEQEINRIRSELQQKENYISHTEDTSGILFGFMPVSTDDFTEIDVLAAAHSITPVIILDCALEKDMLMAILKQAVVKNYEVVLAGEQVDNSVLRTADETKKLLTQLEYQKSPVFLLRNKEITKENQELLKERGYSNLIMYNESLHAGMQENGEPYICYGFFIAPNYYSDYISQIVASHTMMLASFDFLEIQKGTFQISDIDNFLTITDNRKAANELRYVDLDDAFQEVVDQNITEQSRKENYEKYKAEQEVHIQELEEKISEIYSHWDE